MQFKEEGSKETVDISRGPDAEMRPDRPVPPGCGQGHAGRSSACAEGVGATPERAERAALNPRAPGHNASRAYT